MEYSYNDITMINEQGQQGPDQNLQLPIHTYNLLTKLWMN